MRVLVTGSRGFIGSALVTGLRRGGVSVREMDLSGDTATRGDIGSTADCRKFCKDIEIVVHAAAIHHAAEVRARPDEVMRVNSEGTDTLISAAEQAGVRRVVYLSTAKIYGDPASLPSRESDTPDPLDAYASAKLVAEQRCLESHRARGTEVAIIRPFSVYGVGQDLDTGYIGMLLAALQASADPEFPGRSDFVRDFVYIDDVVRLIIACVVEPLGGPVTLNAGSGQVCTLADLVGQVSALMEQDIRPHFRTPPPSTITRSHADMRAAASRFGYVPQVQLADGLRRCVDWALRPHLQPRAEMRSP